jgi:unsaturated chondroitin disaccharide hydrolase
MIQIDQNLKPADLQSELKGFWRLSGEKILLLDKHYDEQQGAPVFTVQGRYTTRGWTEWTQGFQFGSQILQYEACGEQVYLEMGRTNTIEKMAAHVSHTGVHDHGFNNISTYGNLLRLMKAAKIPFNAQEKNFYELALKVSGTVQASRWTKIPGGGFIYSFNGPHSLFVDTIRSCRVLMLSHLLGQALPAENDRYFSLLERAAQHLTATATYNIFYGEGRDIYDVRGRTAHECIFNVTDGNFRCPNAQQGFSGFSTWTRGLAWAILGFAEELEMFDSLQDKDLDIPGGIGGLLVRMLKAAQAVSDYYIENTCTDGIPYWDTGAPWLKHMGDYLSQAANPFNDFEPVDSSAAAIAAQGLLRLGHYLKKKGETADGSNYFQAGLTISRRLLEEPYLSRDKHHQGLLLHSIYHRPNGWDYIPSGSRIPCGESCMWGDYHLRELMLYLEKLTPGQTYYTFYGE